MNRLLRWIVGSTFLAITCSGSMGQNLGGPKEVKQLLIQPGLSVGEVRASMPSQQVVASLGKPDSIVGPDRQGYTVYSYAKTMGFSVILGSSDLVVGVMCGGDVEKLFTGRTKEGIGMPSTKAEILKVFGEAKEVERRSDGVEVLYYPNRGLRFTLKEGQVNHMSVKFFPPGA